MNTLSRRHFLKGSLACASLAAAGCVTHGVKTPPSAKWSPAFESYKDEKTGALVRRLTRSGKNTIVYQTHPQWVNGMDFFLYYSDRTGSNRPHVLQLETAEDRPLTQRPVGDLALSWRQPLAYALSEGRIVELDVLASFAGNNQGRDVCAWPREMPPSGGMFVSADHKTLYAGATIEPDKKWALLALDIATAKWRTVVELDHWLGHIQANPANPDLIMFCWETGGDSPQRTWLVNSDGTGLRPCYKETYEEWVTHEVWWGAHEVLFTVWPYDDAHKAQPHGVFLYDIHSERHVELYRMPAWHTHGSPDKRWAMADDFDRNIWLIDPDARERRLLSQGHKHAALSTHPHASFTPDSRGIVFNSVRFGAQDILVAELPEWQSLPMS